MQSPHFHSRRVSRASQSRLGATLVEFAVIAPVLFALIFGLFEFGRLVMVQHSVANAAREGCRQLSLATTTSTEQIQSTVRGALSASINDTGNTSLVRVVASPGSLTGIQSGAIVEVTVEVNYSHVTWLPNNLLGLSGDPVVRAKSSMVRE